MALANTRPLGKLMSLSRGPKLCTGTLAALAMLESMWVIKALWERWRFSSVTVHKSSKYDELLRASDWVVRGSAWIYLYTVCIWLQCTEKRLRESLHSDFTASSNRNAMNLQKAGRNRRNTFLHYISTQISLDPHHCLHALLFSCILDMDTLGDMYRYI